jgi:RNA polymerase sigma-70 factor (ECF subfamily)
MAGSWGGPVPRAERPQVSSIDIERWRDRSAFQRIYVQEWRDLCAFLRARFGAGPPDPEDVAQQAFLKLGERPADQALESPRAFVFRVAINLTLDDRRRQRRVDRSLVASGPELSPPEDPGLEQALIAKDDLKLLEQVIAGLPERHRRYLAANRIEGLSFAEIARRQGVSESLVRKTIDEAAAVCQRALARGTIDYRGLSRERSRRS